MSHHAHNLRFGERLRGADRVRGAGGELGRGRGFTLVELVVALAVLFILFALSAAAIAHARKSKYLVTCTANLHALGVAFDLYADSGFYPQPSTSAQWEDLLRVYNHRNTFHCPADQELFVAFGSSYDWRDTGDPLTTMAGRPKVDAVRSGAVLSFDMLPGWHATNQINVVDMSGAVRLMDQDAFFSDLKQAVGGAP